MSLLDTASLIVTPNGYKEGKLYSVIPSDGSGDLSVTRATTATRVNSSGLVELVPYNLFTYSSSFSNAAWAKVNSTVTGGQNGYDGTTNAFLITDNSTSGVHLIGQTPVVSGQHTISIYAKADSLNWIWLRGVQSSANVRAWFNLSTGTIGTVETNGTANIESIGNGWYRCSLTIANHESGFEFYYGVSNADNTTSYVGSGQSIFVQDAQLVEGSAVKDYQKTETRLNIPRLDYSNGTCPSILVEPQRTNSCLNSEDFSAASWINFQTSETVNNTTAPNGLNTADRMTQTGAGSGSIYNAAVTLSGASTASCYFKAGTSDFVAIDSNGTAGYWGASFNLTTLAITYFGSGTNGKIEDVGNGWYRCSVSANVTGTNYLAFGIIGNVSDYVYLWGAQLEAGSYATSYIPTTSASVTRNADVISKTGISSLIGQTEGTLFWDVDFQVVANNDAIFIKDNASYDTFVFMQKESSGIIACGYYGSGALQARIESSAVPTGRYKIAFAYKNNDFVMYLNGTQVGTDTSGTVSGLMDYFDLHWTESGCNNVYASALWKTRLTNAQLATLTTI